VASVKVPGHLKEHVRSIKENLPTRPNESQYAPHFAMLSELGYSDAEINAAFGWEPSMRYLRRIKRAGRMDGSATVKVEPSAVAKEKLAPEYQAMLEWTPEAFISFYNRFCDKPMPDHCRDWVQAAFDSELLLLNVPPRHNKSTLFSVWWTVWNLVRNRDHQTLIVSLTDTLSSRWVGYIASILAFGDIPQIFGRFKPEKMDGELPWRPSRGELMIIGRSRGGGSAMQFSVLSRGAGSQILGFEADTIIADDVTSKRIAVSEIERQKQIEWFQEEVMSRLQPDGRAIVVGQRVHMNDLYGHLREMVWDYGREKGTSAWGDISFPAVIQWPDEEAGTEAVVLWPQVWSYEKLMKRKVIVGGTATFMTMYQQDPQGADATLVREEWLEGCRDYDRRVGVGARAEKTEDAFIPVVRVASLDPSPTKYNGLVVADVIYSREQFFAVLIDIKSFKADWHSIRREINQTIDRYNPTYFLFEKNIAQYWAKGDPFIEELRQKVRVMEHTTSAANKYELEAGLESLAYDFEFGNIRMPYKDAESKAVSQILEKEARNWSREGRLVDDVLMALWFIKYNWRRLSPIGHLATTFRGAAQVEAPYRQRLRGNEDVVAAFRKRREQMRRRSA